MPFFLLLTTLILILIIIVFLTPLITKMIKSIYKKFFNEEYELDIYTEKPITDEQYQRIETILKENDWEYVD